MALSQYCFRPVSVCSVTVSARRTGERLSHFFFMSCHEKKGNVNNFFYENGKNRIHTRSYDRCADQEEVSGGGGISHFRENSNLIHSHCYVTPKKALDIPDKQNYIWKNIAFECLS